MQILHEVLDLDIYRYTVLKTNKV